MKKSKRRIYEKLKSKFPFLYFLYCFSTSSTQLSPATNTMTRPTPPPGSIASMAAMHAAPPTHSIASNHSSLPPPLFAAPMPPPAVSSASGTTAPHPFSAESLFQSSAKGKRPIHSFIHSTKPCFLYPFCACVSAKIVNWFYLNQLPFHEKFS